MWRMGSQKVNISMVHREWTDLLWPLSKASAFLCNDCVGPERKVLRETVGQTAAKWWWRWRALRERIGNAETWIFQAGQGWLFREFREKCARVWFSCFSEDFRRIDGDRFTRDERLQKTWPRVPEWTMSCPLSVACASIAWLCIFGTPPRLSTNQNKAFLSQSLARSVYPVKGPAYLYIFFECIKTPRSSVLQRHTPFCFETCSR